MTKPSLELADVFRLHGDAWRMNNRAHLSKPQALVMACIEQCRTSVLGGHVEQCEGCDYNRISYNSCRNRHCPKCQASSAKEWLEAREAELLPISYFHIVFTLPAKIAALALQNKPQLYGLLFKTSSETLQTLARDKKYLDAQLGITAILHTWGQNLEHHPHIHAIVTGGGLRGKEWVHSRSHFLFPVRVLSRLYRRLFLTALRALHKAKVLQFYNKLEGLNDFKAFDNYLQSCADQEWVVYAKKPFASPNHVLAYLSRYTHRVAISNSRLLSMDDGNLRFRWKDYRETGSKQFKTMQLTCEEFIRRFLLHVLPEKFHRIRHFGFLAQGKYKAEKLAIARRALNFLPTAEDEPDFEAAFNHFEANTNSDKPKSDKSPSDEATGAEPSYEKARDLPRSCPCCGSLLRISEIMGKYSRYRARAKGFNSS